MKLIFVIILSLSYSLAWSKEVLSVCTLKLPGNMVIDSNSGFIIDLLQETLGSQYQLDIKLLPTARTINTFLSNDCDLLATHMENTLEHRDKKKKYIELPTGLQDFLTVFSHSENQLNKFDPNLIQKVISIKGWQIPQELNNQNQIQRTYSIDSALNMVKAKRVDYFIGFSYLVNSHISQIKMKKIYFDEAKKHDLKKVVFVLQEGKEQVQTDYKKTLKKIIESGIYSELHKKYKTPSWLKMTQEDLYSKVDEH